MTWLFAILVVAVIGVVAVVATGRGGAMAETFDDRPDSRVQADGPLTAQDLRRVRFSTAFRGYRMSEVDALLDRLAAELDAGATDAADPGDGAGAPDARGTAASDPGYTGETTAEHTPARRHDEHP